MKDRSGLLTFGFYETSFFVVEYPDIKEIVKACDQYNIPFATNIATAELLILGLANGDLDWRMNLKKGESLF